MTEQFRSIGRLRELISSLTAGNGRTRSEPIALGQAGGFSASRRINTRIRRAIGRVTAGTRLGPVGADSPLNLESPIADQHAIDEALAVVPKDVLTAWAEIQLEIFLNSDTSIAFEKVSRPKISVLLVLFNRAELTLACLSSLRANNGPPYEVVIVDNNSSDQTPSLLSRIDGATILRNPKNLHFLHGINQAVQAARGEHLLLLNNDTELLPGALEAALTTLESGTDIGAVGGKLILPSGQLQEAGSIIWKDGSCLGYGRGLNPFDPVAMFRRDVDYCSAAFLLTPKAVFDRLGGFDSRFAPAYYEETDYCMRLWAEGLRVIYEPRAVVLHHEFASSRSATEAIHLQEQHQEVFVQSHAEQLKKHHPPLLENALEARFASQRSLSHALLIDDRIPCARDNPADSQISDALDELVRQGTAVTFLLTKSEPSWHDVYRNLPREVEVLPGFQLEELERFLESRRGYYHTIRAGHGRNIERLTAIARDHPDWFNRAPTPEPPARKPLGQQSAQ